MNASAVLTLGLLSTSLVAVCSAADGETDGETETKWTTLFAKEDWYQRQDGKETMFRGKLKRVPNAGGPSTLQRTSHYSLGGRTIYTGARKHPGLERLVGKTVEMRGKAVDFELEGRSLRELWPAAVRAAAVETKVTLDVEPAKKAFPAGSPIELRLTFHNTTKSKIAFDVVEYLGNQTVGPHRYEFRESDGKTVWHVGQDPFATLPKSPLQLLHRELEPGESFVLTTRVPIVGQRFWHGGTEERPKKTAAHLPAGRYELTVSTMIGDETVTGSTKVVVAEK